MQTILRPVADPSFLLPSHRNIASLRHRNSQPRVHKSILCAANRRNRNGVGKSGKLVLESACIVASKLGILPEPLGLVLREFGSGSGGGNGSWKGFGWSGFDGWKPRRTRTAKLGVRGILVICGVVGMGLVVGTKGAALDSDALFRGLGLLLFGVSVEGWRRGVKDWILGFCCCAFLVGLVLKKEDSGTLLGFFETLKKKARRKRRAF